MQPRTFFRPPASDGQYVPALEKQYANWRREARAVAESYRCWNCAPPDQRWLAYATYLAMLDREERAAYAYRLLVERGSSPEGQP